MGDIVKITSSNAHQIIDEMNDAAYQSRGNEPNLVIAQATEALKLAREWDYEKGIGHATRTIAAVEVRRKPSEGYILAMQAIEILEGCGDESGIASALMAVFCYYHHVGWYQESLQILQDAYEKANRSGNAYVASVALFNMGVSSEERDDFKTALEYYERAMERADGGVNDHSYWMSANAYARLNAMRDYSDKWVDELIRVRENILRLGNIHAACDSSNNLAKLYALRGQFAESLREIRSSRVMARAHGLDSSYSAAVYEYGEIQIINYRLFSALRAFIHAYRFAKLKGYAMVECKALERIAFVQKSLGMHAEAVDNLYEHLRLKEQLLNEQSETRLRELQTYHKLELVQAEAQLAKRQNDELAAMNEELHISLQRQEVLQRELMRLASTDELTGSLNRRQVINDGILEMERYRHTSAPFCVTVIDIDHFKSINDTFGHSVGDEVLRRLAKACQSKLRRFDVFGRLGGEEFCIIHHDTGIHGAKSAVERLLETIASLSLGDILDGAGITASMGICEVKSTHESFFDVLHDADVALYAAKASGRNNFKVQNSHILRAA